MGTQGHPQPLPHAPPNYHFTKIIVKLSQIFEVAASRGVQKL